MPPVAPQLVCSVCLRAVPASIIDGRVSLLVCARPHPFKVVRLLQVNRGWLQESMVYIILGIAVGGLVLLYEGGREQDVSAVRSRAAIVLVPAPSYVGMVHFHKLCTFSCLFVGTRCFQGVFLV